MKPAYYQSQNTGRDRWMISYLDVLTIMLILFVAIAAQALQSAQKKSDPAVAPVAVPVAVPLIPAPNAALVAIKRNWNRTT